MEKVSGEKFQLLEEGCILEITTRLIYDFAGRFELTEKETQKLFDQLSHLYGDFKEMFFVVGEGAINIFLDCPFFTEDDDEKADEFKEFVTSFQTTLEKSLDFQCVTAFFFVESDNFLHLAFSYIEVL